MVIIESFTTHKGQKTLEIKELITEMKNLEKFSRTPDTIILPGVVVQYLDEQGYHTQEQVIQLVKDICAKDS